MPKLGQHQSTQITKMILIGESGTGKTGSLVSLVKAGYKLHIIDLDNGLDVLVNMIKQEPNSAELLDLVDYFTITDRFKNLGGKAVPINSDVWPRVMAKMSNWTNKSDVIKGMKDGKPANLPIPAADVIDLGDPAAWGPDHILVVDSFTFLCKAAMRTVLRLNNRPAGPIYESDWNEAQTAIEEFLSWVYDVGFNTNVIMTAHIDYQTEGTGKDRTVMRVVPQALGKKLGPKVGRYFNSMLEVRRIGVGAGLKRNIHTVPAGMLELKNPAPAKVKPQYDISDGLAEFFKAVRS
jgi:hypothetical protein